LRSQGPASLALCALSRPKHLSAPLTTPPSPPQSTACVTPRPSSRAAARRRQPQSPPSPPRPPAAAHDPAACRSSPSAQPSRPRPAPPLPPAARRPSAPATPPGRAAPGRASRLVALGRRAVRAGLRSAGVELAALQTHLEVCHVSVLSNPNSRYLHPTECELSHLSPAPRAAGCWRGRARRPGGPGAAGGQRATGGRGAGRMEAPAPRAARQRRAESPATETTGRYRNRRTLPKPPAVSPAMPPSRQSPGRGPPRAVRGFGARAGAGFGAGSGAGFGARAGRGRGQVAPDTRSGT
jgi:hypothetical protein